MKFLSILFICFIAIPAFGQNNNLTDLLNDLKSQIGKVEEEKKWYEQEFNFDENSPFKVKYIVKETDSKGKTVKRKALINLGMLDKNLVKRENSKSLMWISVKSGTTSTIKNLSDGELSDYTNVIQLLSMDVDNARAIEDLMKKIIPLAEKEWKNSISLPKDYAGLKSWFFENVKDVNVGEVTYTQSLEDAGHPTYISLNIEEQNAKGSKKIEKLGWSLADIHEPSVKMKVRRNVVAIEASIRKNQEFISVEENGVMKGYAKSLMFYADDVDQAHIITLALKEAIPLARAEAEKLLINPASVKEGLQLLSGFVKNFEVNAEAYEQSLIENQETQLVQKTTTGKGSAIEEFDFDFSDLNKQSVKIGTSRQLLFVEADTKEGLALIGHTKNGEQQNYVKRIKILVPDLHTAKQLQHVLDYILQNASSVTTSKDFEWLKTSFASFDGQKLEIDQGLDLREGEKCKLSFSTRKESGKKVDEHLYEFNLYDIDAKKISLIVKGRSVMVSLLTNYGENIIKDYENGGKINYTKQVAFAVPDVGTGKAIVATFQDMINNCGKK